MRIRARSPTMQHHHCLKRFHSKCSAVNISFLDVLPTQDPSCPKCSIVRHLSGQCLQVHPRVGGNLDFLPTDHSQILIQEETLVSPPST